MHIGLIGGIGPAATEFYYRGLVDAHASAGRKMDLTIVHADAHQLVENLTKGAAEAQSEVFLRLVQRLQAAGAEAAAVTSMGGHFCIRELEAMSPLPLIKIVPAMAAELARRKLRRVGLLGTRAAMASHLYGGIPDVEVVLPQGDDLDATHAAYVAMATPGRVTDQQRALFFSIGSGLVRNQGAEVVVLAGTDLFLAFNGFDSGFPVIDSARVHIDALFRASIGDAVEENPDTLGELAGQCGLLKLPLFMFQEGRDRLVQQTFSHMARVSGGAFAHFDVNSAGTLAALLGAVARYAAGGRTALENNGNNIAKQLLQQLP